MMAMRKTQSMRDGLSNFGQMSESDAQKKLNAPKSMMHIKDDKHLELHAETWFDQLKIHEIQRNKLKQNNFSQQNIEDFLRNIEDDMQRIKCSYQLLNIYNYCEKFAHAQVRQRDAIKTLEQRYIARARDMYSCALHIGKSPKLCGDLDKDLLETQLNEVRYLRKHVLHAKFGLHNDLKRSDITQDHIYACKKYMHVDLTYAELEKQIVGIMKSIKSCLPLMVCPSSSPCNVS